MFSMNQEKKQKELREKIENNQNKTLQAKVERMVAYFHLPYFRCSG